MNDDLPLEVIRAIKKLYDYLNDSGYTDVQINSYIGTTKLTRIDKTQRVITPIALDMMLLRQDK